MDADRHPRRRSRRGGRRAVDHPDPRRRDRHQPRRRHRRRRATRPRRRPVRGHLVWMSEAPMLPGRPYLLKLGTRTVGATVGPPQVQGQRQHAGAHRSENARAQRDRRVQPHPRSAGPLRPLRREPRHGRLHPDRPDHQRDGRRRAAPLRPAPRRERALAGGRGRQGRPRGASTASDRRVVWFTGLSGAGKSTIANLVEKQAAPAGLSHLPPRRRQRPARAQQGSRLHRRRPGREHPARRPRWPA